MAIPEIPRVAPQELIRARADETPERLALSDTAGRDLTFADLHVEGLRWAGALSRAGVGAHDHVASLMPNGLAVSGLWLGLGWLGAVDVSVNTAYRGEMLSFVLANSRARLLVVDAELVPVLAEVLHALPDLRLVVVQTAGAAPTLPVPTVTLAEFLDGAAVPARPVPPRISDVQGIVYTSGTTGNSKGVLVHWGRHQEGVRMFREWVRPDDVWYSMFPACHNSAKIWMRIVPFLGCRAVLSPAFKTQTFWSDVTRAGGTACLLLPNMLHWLLMAEPSEAERTHTLREVVGYGPELPAFGRRFGVPVHVNYGNTEGGNTLWHLGVEDTSDGYSGRAHPPFHARVVDPDDVEVPVGEVGELVVRCDEPWMMFSEYLDDERATICTLRNGWYHTGDAFRQDADGGFWFVDRQADYIRRRGENISSYEVERFVLEHPHVVEAAAIGVPDAGGEDEVKICVVLDEGREPDPAELVAFLAGRMPAFMVPRYVEVLPELPKTEATKRVRKRELRARGLEGTWDRVAAAAERVHGVAS